MMTPPAQRRVRHEVADGAAVALFSLASSVALAVVVSAAIAIAKWLS